MKHFYSLFVLLVLFKGQAQNYNYTVYSPGNSNIQNSNVNHIAIDSNGLLWLSTFSGLSSFNGTTFTHYTTQSTNIPSNSIRKTVIDNLNRKWMATYNDGIVLYNGSTFTNYKTSNSPLPSNMIHDITIDGDNNIWIATLSGLTKFNGTTWTTYSEATQSWQGNNEITSVVIDASNNVYFNREGSYLTKFDGLTFTMVSDGVYDILAVKGNAVYCRTYGGFTKYVNGDSTEGYSYFLNDSCLLDCIPSSMDIAPNDKVWMGFFTQCNNGGIQNFSDCANYTWTGTNEINYVTALKVQSTGVIWSYVAELGLVKMTDSNLSTAGFESINTALVFPNPVQNTLNVAFDEKIVNVAIYNVMGQNVLNKVVNANEDIIDVTTLEAGTYFVKVNTNGSVKTFKVIKQ